MPLADYRTASGYRILAGKAGEVYQATGRIYFQKAPRIGIDSNLWAVLKASVDHLQLAIWCSSIDTGVHIPTSRHYSGCAADIDLIQPMDGAQRPVTAQDHLTLELVAWLRQNGWHVGEGGEWPGLLIGPVHTSLNPSAVPHDRHLHVSVNPHRSHLPESEGFGDTEIRAIEFGSHQAPPFRLRPGKASQTR